MKAWILASLTALIASLFPLAAHAVTTAEREATEKILLRKYRHLIARDGSILTFYKDGEKTGELAHRVCHDRCPPSYAYAYFTGVMRLRDAGGRADLPVLSLDYGENTDQVVVDTDGEAWRLVDGGTASPDGRYIASLTPAMNGNGWYIVDWATKKVHYFSVNCDEGQWISKTELRLVCIDFMRRGFMTYVEARALRLKDGSWILMQDRAVMQALKPGTTDQLTWVARTDLPNFIPIALISEKPFPLKRYEPWKP